MSRWYEIYSPKLNQKKIEKLFNKFNIRCNFANNEYGDYDIYVVHGLYSYKLKLDTKKEELLIFRESMFRNQKGCKEFHTPCYSIKNDVWYKAIKYILK